LNGPLTDEADAGRILLQRDMQSSRFGDPADLALVQPCQRKQAHRQLLLVETMQEIALVLGTVLGLEQLEFPLELAHAGVVAGRNPVGTDLQGMLEKGAELDLRVAQHIRVRRAARLVFGKKVREDALLVLAWRNSPPRRRCRCLSATLITSTRS
jgi:hypothetical protein